MSAPRSPEHNQGTADKLTIAALFVGTIAVAASLLRGLFGFSKKNRHD